jgi:hypothetical protein
MLQSLFVSAGLVACLYGAIRQEYQRGFVRMGVLPSVREARRSANQNRLRADHAI